MNKNGGSQKKTEDETNRVIRAKIEEKNSKTLKKVTAKKGEEEKSGGESVGYESSFIDDDDLSIDLMPNKRKKPAKSPLDKKQKLSAAGKCKKTTLPSIEELSNAMKSKR
jgi:hypothetical protein